MATNARNEGREYPSREDVQRMQDEEDRDERVRNRREGEIKNYLRNHPSDSYAEAEYRTRR